MDKLNKMWYIYILEYYSVKKKTWNTATCYVLDKRKQPQRLQIICLHLFIMSKIHKSTKTKSRLVVVKGWGQWEKEGVTLTAVVFLWIWILKLDFYGGCNMNITVTYAWMLMWYIVKKVKIIEPCSLKMWTV